MHGLSTVCIYAASYNGNNEAYVTAAKRTGTLLGRLGINLAYGAGDVGLMGAAADAMMAEGSHVEGIIPLFMVERNWHHKGINKLTVTPDMASRKAMMAQKADAFIALPGAVGTLEELSECICGRQLGLHNKPIVLLNTQDYYKHLVAFFGTMKQEGFAKNRPDGFSVANTPEELVSQLTNIPAEELASL